MIVEYYKRESAMPNGRALTHIRLDMPDVIKEMEANHFHLIEGERACRERPVHADSGEELGNRMKNFFDMQPLAALPLVLLLPLGAQIKKIQEGHRALPASRRTQILE